MVFYTLDFSLAPRYIPALQNPLKGYVMPSKEYTALLKTLLKLLKEQAEAIGHRLTNEQIANLTYTFRKVLPGNSDELAFVIALGLQQKFIHDMVKEYLPRKRHKELSASYCRHLKLDDVLLKTYGIIVYREQIEPLLRELTGEYLELPATIFMDKEILTNSLKPEYRKALSKKDIEAIHEDLKQYSIIGMSSYFWCHDMAEHALKITKKDKN